MKHHSQLLLQSRLCERSEAIQIDTSFEILTGLLRCARKDGWVCNDNKEKLRMAL